MSYNRLQLQFIESYLREGVNGTEFRALKDELYRQGFREIEVIEMLVAAQLYGNLENFYRKHPELALVAF